MAVAFEGFSIREYASKKRAENVARSWPFGGDADEKRMESILPPITVTKFRWWLHELESARPSHARAAVQPETPSGCAVCSGGLEASSAVAAHAGEETKRRSKSKPKAPKKRSIVEIFAVAPQIKAAAAGNEASCSKAGGDASGSRNFSPIRRKKKKNKKKNKRKSNLLDRIHLLRLDNTKFKKTKKKKRKRNHRNSSTAIEENTCMVKRKAASKRTRNSDGAPDGIYKGGVFDRSVRGNKPRLKSSPSLTKHEAVRPPNFPQEQNKLNFPVRGILKKQGKLVLDLDTQDTAHLEKHVKFLDNAEVQGIRQDSPASIQHSDGHSESSDKFIGSDEEFGLVEATSGDDGDPVRTENGNEAEVTAEKEHTQEQGNAEYYPGPQHSSPHHCRNNLSTESNSTLQVPKTSQDLRSSMKGKSAVIDDSATTENSRFLSPRRGTHVANTNVQTPVSPLSYNVGGSSRAVCGASTIRSSRIFSQPTPSPVYLNGNLNGSFSLHSRFSNEHTSTQPMFYQEVHSQRPVSLISGAFTFADQRNPRPCSLTEECTYQDLCGLPLNSRGELIQMNSASSSNFVLKQLHSSGMASGPFRGQNPIRPSYAENDLGGNEGNFAGRSCPRGLDLFPMHNSDSIRPDVFRGNPERHVSPSRLPNTDLNLVNASIATCGRQGYDSVQHQKGLNEAIPPTEKQNPVLANAAPLTMRLMGKDVAVVGSNTREPADGNVWTDKEIIIEHQQQKDPFIRSNLQNSNGSANLLLEPQNNWKCKSAVREPESLLLNPYINGWPDSVPQRNRFPFTRSMNPEQQLHSHVSFSFTDSREPLVTEPRLALPPYHHGGSHYVHWVPEQNYRPNPPHPRAAGFDLPFLHRDCAECAQQDSLFQGPFMDIPPWLHSSEQGRSMPTAYSVSFPDEIHRNYLCQAPPSRYNSSVTFTAYGPADPRLQLRSPFGPLPTVRAQLLEAVPGIEPASVENITYRSRMNPNGRMKPPAFGVRAPDLCARTKKRPAVRPVDTPRKLDKMANLGPPKHWSNGVSLANETFSHEVEFSGDGTMKLDSSSGKSSRTECVPDGSGTGIQRFDAYETARPGPTRLSAGARHILKPTENADQDMMNSRPIHSVVPYGPGGITNYNMTVPESQTPATKIYKI